MKDHTDTPQKEKESFEHFSDEDEIKNHGIKKDKNSATSPPSQPLLKHVKLPYYLSEAFEDLYQEDGLVVFGRGLGLLHLLAAFCRFYIDKDGHYSLVYDEIMSQKKTKIENQILRKKLVETKPLVFVIGLRDYERETVISTLEKWGTPTESLPREVTNESGQGKDRAILYERGGIFLITSRILIVDLLTHVASPVDIDGILVAHAENISDQSMEAFILRIYRTQKRWGCEDGNTPYPESAIVQSFRYGFVKAFTDAPDVLMMGFAKVDKILKALYLKRLYLYPRFHSSIVEELETLPPTVEELRQPLTQKVRQIQSAIVAAVQVSR